MKNIGNEFSPLITFWQFVKATGMDYNEFKSTLGFNKRNELLLRDLWDKIHFGNVKFEVIQKEFVKSDLNAIISAFLHFLYKAQTGIDIESLEKVEDFNNDIIDWDNDKLYDTYEKLYKRMPEVPFITELIKFDENRNRKKPYHFYITSLERKIPNGPFTIREYDSDRDDIEEYQSNQMHCPLVYDWIKGNGEELQKAGNFKT